MKRAMLSVVLMMFLGTVAAAQDPQVDLIEISGEESVQMVIGDEITFSAVAYDVDGNEIAAEIVWSVMGEIGEIDDDGEFKATAAGTGSVIAASGDISADVEVIVSEEEGEEPEFEMVEVTPSDASAEIGGTVQFEVVVKDADGVVIDDPEVVWESSDIAVGTVDEAGFFTAVAEGDAVVTATSGENEDTAEVTVTGAEEPDGEQVIESVEVFPQDETVAIGETVQYEAEARDSEDEEVDIETIEWSLSNTDVGSIDETTGLFTAAAEGETQVIALVGDISGDTEVTVVEEIILEEGVNTITLQRQHPDGKITKFGSTNVEGDTLKIGGIPHPFNYMNGMKLYFPDESLHEDIMITIKIPEKVANINNQKKEVEFEGDIVNAVTFNVSVDGVEQHPYDFDTLIELSLPYKKGLLTKLGIEPEDLTIYYIDAEGNLASEGISEVILDAETNKITGTVAHFSDFAMAPKDEPTVVEENSQPSAFTLSQNFPNPFNPETTISYYASESSHVTISIFNIVGQNVRTLVETVQPAGSYTITWDGKDNTGSLVTSGIYFCRMEAGNFSQTRKLMFMK
ncbi:hypothetical protein ES708_12295 [subsurface metagenome]